VPRDDEGVVCAVSSDDRHRFSKSNRPSIRLVADSGVEGDVHAGEFVQHRFLARRNRRTRNLRQVHLIQSELLDEVRALGFVVKPGELGENITTRGIDLPALPLASLLQFESGAEIDVTGLRTPCVYIDRFQKGLQRAMIVNGSDGRPPYRSGIMGIVRTGGVVSRGDRVRVLLPDSPWQPLPAL
jgi:MOSC domain-containing protein YiiM